MKKWILLLSILSTNCFSKEAPGSPGIIHNWTNAKKVHVGTSFEENSAKSPLWFTSSDGILTEVYYPTIDKAQIKDSQILITDSKELFLEEKNDLNHETIVINGSKTLLKNTDKKNRFNITHDLYTYVDRPVLVDHITISTLEDGLSFYLLVNPALNNTGASDSSIATNDSLIFNERNQSLKVYSTCEFDETSVGFVGFSDGYQDLKDDKLLNKVYKQANNGNVAGTAKLKLPPAKGVYECSIIYDFSDQTKSKMILELEEQKIKYHQGWDDYLRGLNTPSEIAALGKDYLNLYLKSLFVLKTHEDKLNPGAMIASLSIPWGEDQYDTEDNQIGGYHLIWPRDLFHVSLAMIKAGDRDLALRALRFLKRIQYKSGKWQYGPREIPKKGAFPQNTWTTGQEYWGGLQLDQVGYPIQLFYHLYLNEESLIGQKALLDEFSEFLTLALDFIYNYGPWSAQERWEENYGISPSSFSVANTALIIGSYLIDDPKYVSRAQQYLNKPGDNIFTWTYTSKGIYGDGNYFLRTSGCWDFIASWNPNVMMECFIANSYNFYDQRLILDQGFLKLALMGLVDAKDERIVKSRELIDQVNSIKTPKGIGYYRYTFDAYGEEDKGRLWPLLSSEHGRFFIELFNEGELTFSETKKEVLPILKTYIDFANDGMMIPEQVFEDSGEGTGGATPLAWSHAEYIKLLWSLIEKKNVENLLE